MLSRAERAGARARSFAGGWHSVRALQPAPLRCLTHITYLSPAICLPKVTRDAITGELKRTPSWHSFGGEGEGSGSPAGASNGGASEDDGSAVRARVVQGRAASGARLPC